MRPPCRPDTQGNCQFLGSGRCAPEWLCRQLHLQSSTVASYLPNAPRAQSRSPYAAPLTIHQGSTRHTTNVARRLPRMTSIMDDFRLTESDKASGLWLRLRAHFDDRLAAARMRNDDPTLDPAATAAIRGEIKVLKLLIRLDAERPPIEG